MGQHGSLHRPPSSSQHRGWQELVHVQHVLVRGSLLLVGCDVHGRRLAQLGGIPLPHLGIYSRR